MSKNNYTFTIELTSAMSVVQVPITMTNVKRLKILNMRYYTGSVGGKTLLLKIKDWTDNKIYFNGSNFINYTSLFLLNADINVPILYDNYNQTFDCEKDVPIETLSNFQIDVFINNAITSDITPANPLIITLYFEGDNSLINEIKK